MLPLIILGAAAYVITRPSTRGNTCASSERDVEFYRENALQLHNQIQLQENELRGELDWRRTKEKQMNTKRYIAKLRSQQSRCKRGSHKYMNLEYKIQNAIRKKEKLQRRANNIKHQRS